MTSLSGSTPPRVKRIQRTALIMLVVAGSVNHIDRATLSVANPLVRHDLGFSISQIGYLLSAFLFAYAFAQLPAGAMVDRLQPRLVATASLALWSIAQAASGLVFSFSQFYVVRIILGAGEAPQSPTAARVTRDWFSRKGRGLASGIWNTTGPLSTAVGVPLLTYLMLEFGWRWMFIIMGTVGLISAAAWYVVYRNPSEMALSADETAYLTEGDAASRRSPVTFREWKLLLRFRTTWGLMVGYFGSIYMTWIYFGWLPGYLEIQRHMSVKTTGLAAIIPFSCGIAGSLLGGYMADRLIKSGYSPMASGKYPAGLALAGTAIFTLAAAFVKSNDLAIAYISATIFLLYVSSTCSWALSSVAVTPNLTASLGSIMNFGGYFGGALAPTVTGMIVERTGSFVIALVVGAVIATVSAAAYLFVVKSEIPEAKLENAYAMAAD
jgi:sugar phosphate permease